MWTIFKSKTTYNSMESMYHKFEWMKQPHQYRANNWQGSAVLTQWILTAQNPATTIRRNYLSNLWSRGMQLRLTDDLFFAKKIYSGQPILTDQNRSFFTNEALT